MVVSQQFSDYEIIQPTLIRSRALSHSVLNRSITTKDCDAKRRRPKIMKYVQELSNSFENEKLLMEEVDETGRIEYLSAEHKLDGQTYILKKEYIAIGFDQDIQDHPAYKKILEVKDSKLYLNIRYVTSWVELDKTPTSNLNSSLQEPINAILIIQIRYVSDFSKLARDLIVFSGEYKDLDEDDIDDMADDMIREAKNTTNTQGSFANAITTSFNKIGLQNLITKQRLIQTIWKLCYEDALANLKD